ncbi:MAG: hypothetical protein R6V52_09580 [Bacteroidales bacterium]
MALESNHYLLVFRHSACLLPLKNFFLDRNAHKGKSGEYQQGPDSPEGNGGLFFFKVKGGIDGRAVNISFYSKPDGGAHEKGKLGEMLRAACEIKRNGLEYLFKCPPR